MDPEKGDHPKSQRKEEEKQVKRRESVLSSDGDDGDEDEDDFFQLDQEIMNPFLGHVNDGGRVGAADGSLSYPPIQMMWRSPDGADPNRIPSSIFAGPSSPMEWSAASNESLFSIHGGNSSFTCRDHVTLMEKSGELNLPAEDHHHHHPHPQALRDVAGTETDNAKSIKELVQANLEEQQHRSSDCSAVSYQSFAFPMRRKNRLSEGGIRTSIPTIQVTAEAASNGGGTKICQSSSYFYFSGTKEQVDPVRLSAFLLFTG
ncbi:hypothetical protein ZIOFF_013604 [Zingiber officinale]|uniref:Uncharacterized protein n=1 Tax=Zingiber officinale TaxID=94328 RepID=A0A8J5LKZ8_ZINOF|nr:hypothetical protein ZIOFF_013604 [Zingiber officinale]